MQSLRVSSRGFFLQQAKVCNCPGHDGVVHVGGCPPVRRRYLVTRLQTSTDGCPRSTADTPDHVSDANTFACHLRDNAADTPLKISQCTHPVGDQVVFSPNIFFVFLGTNSSIKICGPSTQPGWHSLVARGKVQIWRVRALLRGTSHPCTVKGCQLCAASSW